MLKVLIFKNNYTEFDFKRLYYVMDVLQYITEVVSHYKSVQSGNLIRQDFQIKKLYLFAL